VVGEALLQVGGNADVALADNGFALQQIDVAHFGQTSSVEASQGILLRCLGGRKSCEAHSAKQDGGPGNIHRMPNFTLNTRYLG
jgi:hypothetical protein